MEIEILVVSSYLIALQDDRKLNHIFMILNLKISLYIDFSNTNMLISVCIDRYNYRSESTSWKTSEHCEAVESLHMSNSKRERTTFCNPKEIEVQHRTFLLDKGGSRTSNSHQGWQISTSWPWKGVSVKWNKIAANNKLESVNFCLYVITWSSCLKAK